MRVHVAILTALAEERDAILATLSADKGPVSDSTADPDRPYQIIDLPLAKQGTIRVALCNPTGAGPINGAIGASKMLLNLSPLLTILVGIAGCMGKREEFQLGDVAIAGTLYDYMLGKLEAGRTKPDWIPYPCAKTI